MAQKRRGNIGYITYSPHFLPEDGRYLFARHHVELTLSTEPLGTKTLVDATVSTREFNGQIVQVGFDAPTFDLFSLKTEDPVAQIKLPLEYPPDGVDEEGDSCYISIRLEYDHEGMLDYYDESEIEDYREQFPDKVKEMEEHL